MANTSTKLLSERVRPKKLEHIILLDRIRKQIGDGNITQPTLFAGSAGIGKCFTGDTLVRIYNKDTKKYSRVKISSLME